MEYDYKSQYRERLERFLTKYPNSTELEMLLIDIDIYQERIVQLKNDTPTATHPQNWIDESLRHDGRYLQFLEDKLEVLKLRERLEDNSSGSNVLTLAKKMIYLNELGVFDLLRNSAKMGISNNSIAGLISKIIGENKTSVQPILELFDKEDVPSRKNPYSTLKNVDAIKKELQNIGLKTLK